MWIDARRQFPKPRILPSIVAWNSAVSACARAGQWQRAFRLLGDLEGMTLEADVTRFIYGFIRV